MLSAHGFWFFLFFVDYGRDLKIVGLKDLIAVQAADVIDSISPPQELRLDMRARLHKIRKIGLILLIRPPLSSPPAHFVLVLRLLRVVFFDRVPPLALQAGS